MNMYMFIHVCLCRLSPNQTRRRECRECRGAHRERTNSFSVVLCMLLHTLFVQRRVSCFACIVVASHQNMCAESWRGYGTAARRTAHPIRHINYRSAIRRAWGASSVGPGCGPRGRGCDNRVEGEPGGPGRNAAGENHFTTPQHRTQNSKSSTTPAGHLEVATAT